MSKKAIEKPKNENEKQNLFSAQRIQSGRGAKKSTNWLKVYDNVISF